MTIQNRRFERIHSWADDALNSRPISSSRMDAAFDNIKDGINHALSEIERPSAPVRGQDGTAAAPTYSFNSDEDTGLYLGAAGPVMVLGGEVVAEFRSDGVRFPGGTDVSEVGDLTTEDITASGEVQAQRFLVDRGSGSAPSIGITDDSDTGINLFSTGISFVLNSDARITINDLHIIVDDTMVVNDVIQAEDFQRYAPITSSDALRNVPTPIVPTGVVFPFAGVLVPNGWLLCDGSAVSRTKYSRLWTAIRDVYGVGDGSTTFNLPDLRRRTIVGIGGTGTSQLGNTLGSTGGEERVTLLEPHLPSHRHELILRGQNDGQTGSGINTPHLRAPTWGAGYNIMHTTLSTGGDSPHPNMQPSIVMNYIIAT